MKLNIKQQTLIYSIDVLLPPRMSLSRRAIDDQHSNRLNDE